MLAVRHMDRDVLVLGDQLRFRCPDFLHLISLPQTQNYPTFSRALSVIKERINMMCSGLCLFGSELEESEGFITHDHQRNERNAVCGFKFFVYTAGDHSLARKDHQRARAV